MSVLITNIGELVTNAPNGIGPGPFTSASGAALVMEAGVVAWTGSAARPPAADLRVDAGGRAVLPGFVDSHAHLVFAGERSAEFAARMAGQPYQAGGIRSTVAATRAASDEALGANLRSLTAELALQGTTTFECKSGYGLTVADEARSVALAAAFTREVTYLGAHVVPAEYAERHGRVRGPGLRPDAGRLRAAQPVGGRVLRKRCVRAGRGRRGAEGREGRRADPAGARQPARPRARRQAGRRVRRGLGRPPDVPRRQRHRRAGRRGHGGHAAARRWSSPPGSPTRTRPR